MKRRISITCIMALFVGGTMGSTGTVNGSPITGLQPADARVFGLSLRPPRASTGTDGEGTEPGIKFSTSAAQ
jgi:hypothetical protein